jgi:hypothetical protein
MPIFLILNLRVPGFSPKMSETGRRLLGSGTGENP